MEYVRAVELGRVFSRIYTRAHMQCFMTQNLQNRFQNWDGRITGDSRRCRRSSITRGRGVEHDS